MNDTELDRWLDSWEAPAPPPSWRQELRARFPRAERRRFAGPLRGVLVIAVAVVTIVWAAIGMAQSGENASNFRLARIANALNRMYEDFVEAMEVSQTSS